MRSGIACWRRLLAVLALKRCLASGRFHCTTYIRPVFGAATSLLLSTFLNTSGCFAEHYRANVAALAAAGYDVYAPTLPGYGRAEKPVLPYGQVCVFKFAGWLDSSCRLSRCLGQPG